MKGAVGALMVDGIIGVLPVGPAWIPNWLSTDAAVRG